MMSDYKKKDKVMSIRIEPGKYETLEEIAKSRGLRSSKFVRKIINSELKAVNSDKKIVNLILKKHDYDTIEEKAKKSGIKPAKYLRKLIKSKNEMSGLESKDQSKTYDDDKYSQLENDHEELTGLYEELSQKYNNLLSEKDSLENTIKELTKVKDGLLQELIFAKKGSRALIN